MPCTRGEIGFGIILGVVLAIKPPFDWRLPNCETCSTKPVYAVKLRRLEAEQVADLAEKSVTRTAQILEAKLARLLEG